jgi:hypothetical protein
MKYNGTSSRYHQMLDCLGSLPQKMVTIHPRDNATEFVLHELCSEKCFNLQKAAYFIDNHDFDCFRGVAGFSKQEEYNNGDSHWDSPESFSDHMKSCSFNRKVRIINKQSFKKAGASQQDIVDHIGYNLDFGNPLCFSWPIKHDNEGVLIIERPQESEEDLFNRHLRQGVHLLAFCPIF